MEKYIVEYLAVYDCIQLSREELNTIYIRRLQIHRLRERNGVMMKAYREMNREELLSLKEELDKQFADAKGKGLKLDE